MTLLARCILFLSVLVASHAQATYTVNADGTVSDLTTGLVWDRCVLGSRTSPTIRCESNIPVTYTWANALTQVSVRNNSNYLGHNDWRMPNKNELESLVNLSATVGPTIDVDSFPNTPLTGDPWNEGDQWTSTTYVKDPAHAWIVRFANGVVGALNKNDTNFVRLVRSGHPSASFDYTGSVTSPRCTVTANPPSVVPSGSNELAVSTLTATCTPQVASYRWSGDCANSRTNTCTVMPLQTTDYTVVGIHANGAESAPASVTVNVEAAAPRQTLTVNLTGMETAGTVTSSPAGLTCTGRTCTGQFAEGSHVTLTPSLESDAGYRWWRWGGACADSPAGDNCTVTLNGAKTVELGMGLLSAIRPVFPPPTEKSEVMQGGRVARWFVLESGASGAGIASNYPVNYQIDGEAPKTATTDADGLFAIVTDPQVVLTPNPNAPHRKRVRSMNGLLDAEFDVAVATRSLEQTWQIDANLKGEVGVGPGIELKAKIAGYGPKLDWGAKLAGGVGAAYSINAVHKANMKDDGYVYAADALSHVNRSMSSSETNLGALSASGTLGASIQLKFSPEMFLGVAANVKAEAIVDGGSSATLKFPNYFDPVVPVGPCHLAFAVSTKLLLWESLQNLGASSICGSSISGYLDELKTTTSVAGVISGEVWSGLRTFSANDSGQEDNSIYKLLKSTSIKLSGEGAFKITSENLEKRVPGGASILGTEKKLELLYASKSSLDAGQLFKGYTAGYPKSFASLNLQASISNSSESKFSRTDKFAANGSLSGSKIGATLTSADYSLNVGAGPSVGGKAATRVDTNFSLETDDANDIGTLPGLPLLSLGSIGEISPRVVEDRILQALLPPAPATVKPLKAGFEKEAQLLSFDLPFDLGLQLGLKLGVSGGVKISEIQKYSIGAGKITRATYNGVTKSQLFDLESYDDDQYLNEQRKDSSVIFSQMGVAIKALTDQLLQSAKALATDVANQVSVKVETAAQRASEVTTAGLQAGQELYLTLEKWTISTLQNGTRSRIYVARNIQTAETEKTIGPVHFINLKSPTGAELVPLPEGATLKISKVSQYLADAGLTADMASKVRLFRIDFDNATKHLVGGSYSAATDQLSTGISRTGAYIMVMDTTAPNSPTGLQTGLDTASGSVRISANFATDLTGIDASSMVLKLNGFNVLAGKPTAEFFNPISNFFALAIPQSQLVPGVNRFDLTASDTAGNPRTWSAYITLPGVVTAPVCTLTASPSTINAGESSTLTASCMPVASAYQWGGATSCQSTSAVCTVTPESDSSFSVAGSNSAGVGSGATVTVAVNHLGNQPLQPRVDGTVYDPNTGLVWMRCLMGQTWSANTSTCQGMPGALTFSQAQSKNGVTSFASQSDWRVPTIRELISIVDYSKSNPSIDSTAFPNQPPSYTWSSSAYTFAGSFKWAVSFLNGLVSGTPQEQAFSLRMVRGGSKPAMLSLARPASDYVDVGNGAVSHTPTGLMWQRCKFGQTWVNNTCTGTPTLLTWPNARVATSALAGYADWRLPTQQELNSLIDYTRDRPATNTTWFGTNGTDAVVWSNDEIPNGSPSALGLNLDYGFTQAMDKGNQRAIRFVRGGTFVLSDTECFFAWAEKVVPEYLNPPRQPTLLLERTNIRYRGYTETGVYLGTDGSTVLGIGGLLGNTLLNLGALNQFMPAARAAMCQ